MPKHVRYFLTPARAYRSEIALFRAEGVTADRCLGVVKAPPGLSALWVVYGKRCGRSVWPSLNSAWKAMQARNALQLFLVEVL